MGLTAITICAKNSTIPTNEFTEVFSGQYGDWHCVSILDTEDEGVWSYPKKYAAETGGAVISACCIESDFAEITLFVDGQEVNTFTIGETYAGEIVEPDYSVWQPFETQGKSLSEFLSENSSFVFAEDVLTKLQEVFGFPLFVMPQ